MSQKEPKKKLVGPLRSIHGFIWLVGIIILAAKGWWWPGILVLVLISAIYEALLRRYAPQAYVEEQPDQPAGPAQVTEPAGIPAAPPAVAFAPSTPEHRLELLPHVCPSCNGPIRGHEVKWTGPQSADCPYCGTNLPMSKA
jgi:hypothetical protein